MAYDVFISHSTQDGAVANAICSRLEESGIRCWIAPRDVRPGKTWGSEIIRGLDNAKVMIVVLSANSNRSRPVIKEVERAFGKDKVIITVRTEEVVLSQDLEFFLSSDQWLDAITPPLEAHLARLAEAVRENLVEQGWTESEGTSASSAAPAATAGRLSKEVAGETRRSAAATLNSATKEHSFVNKSWNEIRSRAGNGCALQRLGDAGERMGKLRISFRGANSGLRLMTRGITSVRVQDASRVGRTKGGRIYIEMAGYRRIQ